MHILEQYALNCGAPINKPFILEEFFPLPFEKYITLHPKGKFASREYDYWEEVVSNLYPILEKNNIKIVQVGAGNDQPLPFCYHTQGQTTFNSLAYIIKNSLLHIGIDSFPIHLASFYDRKIVGLYCNMYSNQSGPYWSKAKDVELLMAELGDKKPSYSAVEMPKTINTIKPEDIVNSTLKKLDINEKYQIKSLYIGEVYHLKSIEVVPDHVPNLSTFNTNVANVRMDLHFNEENLHNIISVYKTNILTNKPLNAEKLSRFKNNLMGLFYLIEDLNDFSVDFIKKLKSNGIKFSVVSFLSEEETEKIKIHTMDFCNIVMKDFNKNKDILSKIEGKNIKFKSSKILLSQGKIYPNTDNFLNNIPYNTSLSESFDLKKNSMAYKDLETLYIFAID